jgi:exopolysaccharide biosynthesis polyprenyl glycosylphosphotransferase
MYNQQFKILVNTFMVFDAVIIAASGYLAYFISLELSNGPLAMNWNDFILFLVVANNYFMGRFGFYSDRRFNSTACMVKKLARAVSLSFILLTAAGLLMGIESFSATCLITHFLTAISLLIIVRLTTKFYFDRRALKAFNSHTILIAGPGDRITSMIDALNLQRSWGHTIAGWITVNGETRPDIKCIPHLGTLNDFDRILCDYHIDEVIFDLPRDCNIDFKKYLKKCEEVGVIFRIVPGFFNSENPYLKAENIQEIPTLAVHIRAISATSLLYKKILDLFVGSIGFAIFLILYPFIMLAIKIESPGPVLFKQLRIGLNGRRFYIYKFRSMCLDAESQKNVLLKSCEAPWPEYTVTIDPRVSRVGRFLRKTSLDELPQFINILKGEMSLVGTRPPTPEEFKHYDNWHRRRISLKPGLTGLWQISGRKDIKDFNQVVKLDLEYIDNYRFRNDLLILWKTLWVVFAQKGAK